jgi:hypothetical protein
LPFNLAFCLAFSLAWVWVQAFSTASWVRDMTVGSKRAIRCSGSGTLHSLLSSRYGIHAETPHSILSWRGERGRRRGRRSCTLLKSLKSRDPHLAGGEKTAAWQWVWDDPGHW